MRLHLKRRFFVKKKMDLSSRQLLDELLREARKMEAQTAELRNANATRLHQRPSPQGWNALECLEHLNLTYDYYLPQLEKAIGKAKDKGWKPESNYQPGFLGKKMIESVRPGDKGKIGMKMKTFKRTTPAIEGRPAEITINRFLIHHRQFIQLIEAGRGVNLQRPRVTSLIGPALRFRLGDALRFLQAHNERHWLQLERAMGKAPVGEAV